jgi:hypothetical protein
MFLGGTFDISSKLPPDAQLCGAAYDATTDVVTLRFTTESMRATSKSTLRVKPTLSVVGRPKVGG